jgi:LacI family transcriptional regulator
MKSKITIKDIAKELGVSISTVSKALKDSHEISEETRKRIKAFADFYHYKPNSLALKLRNKKTMVIGIVIPNIVHHFFSRVIKGIDKVATERGYNLMICLSNESYDKELLNIDMLADGSVDGLLISIAKETLEKKNFNHYQQLIEDEIPFVLFDRVADEIPCDKVLVDDIGGGYKATNHLIDIGCKRIAILTTPDHVNVGAERKEGYIKALEENNRKIDNELVVKIDEHLDIAQQIEKLFIVPNRVPDGIFAVNEIYAATAMKIAREKGLNIPQDIAIIGFTDGLISEFSAPPLSTVAQHGFTMGEQAVELLLNRIQKKENTENNFERKVISTNLKIRNSTQKSKF